MQFVCELRAEVAGDRLVGYASVFGQVAKIPEGYEEIGPGAFGPAMARADFDPIATRDHNRSWVLGRVSAGTLHLGTDQRGLHFEIPKLPNTTYANDMRELIERGDLKGASFAFKPGRTERARAKDGRTVVRHTEVASLHDVSVVTDPAYGDAAVQLRSFDWSTVPALTAREQLLRLRMRRYQKGA